MNQEGVNESIDAFLVKLLEQLDPDQLIPDENSYSLDRATQFKAPDHFLFDRRILVERKSLQGEHDALINRIDSITAQQGERFIIFGQIGIEALFRKLAEPEKARDRFVKMSVNKFEQRIKEARDKFREHSVATGVVAASRIVIVTDESENVSTDGILMEWFCGQLFLRSNSNRDKVGLTDSIIYIRHPAQTIPKANGHWFKWVTRDKLPREKRRDISWFGSVIFASLQIHFESQGEDARKFGAPREVLV